MAQFKPYCKTDHTGAKTQIKATRGAVHSVEISNPTVVDLFVQVFDGLAADVVLGTTDPKQSWFVPAGTTTNRGARDLVLIPPMECDTAITFAVTTTPKGSTLPASAVTINFIWS